MNYEIGHSFCDYFIMPRSLEIAAKSERRFLPKEKITAFYHPPRSEEIYNNLKDLLTIKKVNPLTPPFSTHDRNSWYSYYGEKIQLANINCPNIMFLDCDCLTIHDPSVIWDDDFDVAVMDATPWKKEHVMSDANFIKGWNKMFENYNKKSIPFFQTGIIATKDNIMREIKEEFIELMNEDLPIIEPFYPKNEYAFALALSDKKIKYLGFDIVQEFEWRKKPFFEDIHDWEKDLEPIICHVGSYGLGVKFDE